MNHTAEIAFPRLELLLLVTLIAGCQATSGPSYGRGESFGVLAYPDGHGTLLFFYEIGESLGEKIKFDVGLVSEQYGQALRIVLINATQKPGLIERHRVTELPTIIIFDRLGTEFHRWLRWDFRDDFSRRDFERVIEKLAKPKTDDSS